MTATLATTPTCQACNGSGATLGEFALTLCPCAGRPSAEALAAAIRETAEQQRRATLLVRLGGTGPALIDCPACSGEGFIDVGAGPHNWRKPCPARCCGGRVVARCCYCDDAVTEERGYAITDTRLPEHHGVRLAHADWCCGDAWCLDEHAARMAEGGNERDGRAA